MALRRRRRKSETRDSVGFVILLGGNKRIDLRSREYRLLIPRGKKGEVRTLRLVFTKRSGKSAKVTQSIYKVGYVVVEIETMFPPFRRRCVVKGLKPKAKDKSTPPGRQ